jgi:hypothetical protein
MITVPCSTLRNTPINPIEKPITNPPKDPDSTALQHHHQKFLVASIQVIFIPSIEFVTAIIPPFINTLEIGFSRALLVSYEMLFHVFQVCTTSKYGS